MQFRKAASRLILVSLLAVTSLSPHFSERIRADDVKTFNVSMVAQNLKVPVALQFAPDGQIFVGEKYGTIQVIHQDGTTSDFGSLAVNSDFEQGLLGLVIDPNFVTNGYMYVAYTRPDGNFNRVSRITASAANHQVMEAGSEKILLDDIPSPTGIH